MVDVLPASHLNGLQPPSAKDTAEDLDFPRTGSPGLDFLTGSAREQALAAMAEFDALVLEIVETAKRESPEHPFETFRDGVGADGRTGGFDDWIEMQDWGATQASAAEGAWSY